MTVRTNAALPCTLRNSSKACDWRGRRPLELSRAEEIALLKHCLYPRANCGLFALEQLVDVPLNIDVF
jgi:hypothetical protein